MALTDLVLKSLQPKSKPFTQSDGKGLYVEVLPSGGICWRYRYRLHGKQEKVSLGRYPDVSLKIARHKRDELATLVAQGISPAQEKQLEKFARASMTSVSDFGERYFEEVVKRARKDTRIIRRYIDKEIGPAIGSKPMREVTTADIETIVFTKRDHGREAAAADIRNLIKRLFDYAIVCGVADKNPAYAIPTRFITKQRSRTRVLLSDEIKIFLETIYISNIRRQFKIALHLILLTMVRKSELLLASWENIDFENNEWEIPANMNKTGQPHIVYLSKQASELFKELKRLSGNSPLVLPGRSNLLKPFACNSLNKALDGLNFSMEKFTIHDLRRTASTHLHEADFSPDVIEIALNHKINGVRGIYNKAKYSTQRKEMLQYWADYIDSLIENERKIVIGQFRNWANG